MKKRFIKPIFLPKQILIVLLILHSGCFKKENLDDIKIQDWEPGVAVPLVNSTLTLKDIVESIDNSSLQITEDQGGFYTFIYRDTAETPTAEEILQLPDQSERFSAGYTLPEITPFPSGVTITKNFSEKTNFTFDHGGQLKYIDLKDGNLNLSLSSPFRHDVSISYIFNSLLKNGVPLSKTYNLNYSGNVPVTVNDNINLEGYRLNLSGTGNVSNSFEYDVTIKITSSGNPITALDSLVAVLNIQNLKYSLLFGNIGNFPIDPYSSSIDLDIFKKTIQGDIYFENPRIKLTFNNSFGVPVSFTIPKLETVTTEGTILPVTSTLLPGPLILNHPDATEIGKSEITVFEISPSNSNAREVFNPAPSKVNYTVIPDIASADNTFITDKSKVQIFTEAELPLEGRIKIYAVEDTLEINLPDRESVESALFRVRAENSIPVDLHLQAYFLDASNQKIDSLFEYQNDLVESGAIDNNGNVITPALKFTEIFMDAARYDKISGSKKLLLRGGLDTSKNATVNVRIYSFQQLHLQISLLVKAKVKID